MRVFMRLALVLGNASSIRISCRLSEGICAQAEEVGRAGLRLDGKSQRDLPHHPEANSI
jgi:hypothetical protein